MLQLIRHALAITCYLHNLPDRHLRHPRPQPFPWISFVAQRHLIFGPHQPGLHQFELVGFLAYIDDVSDFDVTPSEQAAGGRPADPSIGTNGLRSVWFMTSSMTSA